MARNLVLVSTIGAVYVAYFVFVSIALVMSLMGTVDSYVWLAPAVTISLHFFFMLAGYVFLKDYAPYASIEPKWLFVGADAAMFLAAVVAYGAAARRSTSAFVGVAVNVVAVAGNLVCFYKTAQMMLAED